MIDNNDTEVLVIGDDGLVTVGSRGQGMPVAELEAMRALSEQHTGDVTPAQLFDLAIEADGRPLWLVTLATMLVEHVAREADREREPYDGAARRALASIRALADETPMT